MMKEQQIKSSCVRVRFAPSPTGHLHIGSLRSAIFNWLFARHHDSSFLVRIEDTDKERSLQKYTDSIVSSLDWMGLQADQPLVFQSDRESEHRAVVQELLASGDAYYAYAPIDFDDEDKAPTAPDGSTHESDPENWVIRLKVPNVDYFTFDDLILGKITFEKEQVPDFVIARSDGTPTYNFVVVLDDLAMNITHVIRGQDHISNTPKQIALYQVLGKSAPHFAHIPLIMSESGSKMSKRDSAVSVIEYKKQGILAPALCNYLVRLGWSHKDQEIFTTDQMIQLFDIGDVGKTNAVFDYKKLLWVNSTYIKAATAAELIELVERDVAPGWQESLKDWNDDNLESIVALYQGRVNTLLELKKSISDLYQGPDAYHFGDASEADSSWLERVTDLESVLNGLATFSKEAISEALKAYARQKGVKLGVIGQPLRVALTGSTSSPGIFSMIACLGQTVTLDRLHRFMKYLRS
jgi:glutamyl-tRNA synthetase